MTRTTAWLAILLLAVPLGACTTTGTAERSGGDPDVLTRAQITDEAPGAATAWDAVRRLRPNWLRVRDLSRSNVRPVLVDGNRHGDTSALREIQVHLVQEIRFFDPNDATLRYGPQYGNGVIVVTTRR